MLLGKYLQVELLGFSLEKVPAFIFWFLSFGRKTLGSGSDGTHVALLGPRMKDSAAFWKNHLRSLVDTFYKINDLSQEVILFYFF